jgi:plasmid stabilization system protein ParE
MGYRVEVSEEAERNIDGILTYMTKKLFSPSAASHFLDDVQKSYTALAENPYLYSLCVGKSLEVYQYRRVVIRNYLMFYQIDEDSQTVLVVAVVYGGRNYASLL